jgi:hypothetical protein
LDLIQYTKIPNGVESSCHIDQNSDLRQALRVDI